MSQQLRIRCAVCNRPVERAQLDTNGGLGLDMRGTIIVHCHGKSDRMTFTGHDILRHGIETWTALMNSEGVAFRAEAAKREAMSQHASDAFAYAHAARQWGKDYAQQSYAEAQQRQQETERAAEELMKQWRSLKR